jgi:hypothetical protein
MVGDCGPTASMGVYTRVQNRDSRSIAPRAFERSASFRSSANVLFVRHRLEPPGSDDLDAAPGRHGPERFGVTGVAGAGPQGRRPRSGRQRAAVARVGDDDDVLRDRRLRGEKILNPGKRYPGRFVVRGAANRNPEPRVGRRVDLSVAREVDEDAVVPGGIVEEDVPEPREDVALRRFGAEQGPDVFGREAEACREDLADLLRIRIGELQPGPPGCSRRSRSPGLESARRLRKGPFRPG